jgi:hypothetical protein
MCIGFRVHCSYLHRTQWCNHPGCEQRQTCTTPRRRGRPSLDIFAIGMTATASRVNKPQFQSVFFANTCNCRWQVFQLRLSFRLADTCRGSPCASTFGSKNIAPITQKNRTRPDQTVGLSVKSFRTTGTCSPRLAADSIFLVGIVKRVAIICGQWNPTGICKRGIRFVDGIKIIELHRNV